MTGEHDRSYALNSANWDDRAPLHAASPGYGLERFVTDPAFLSDVVAFDRARLGDVRGLSGVHLQCHIGTDTVSLARLGARMTGLDFSAAAIEHARAFAARVGADVGFVQANVYDAVAALDHERFDLVYTGVGALNWLPDIADWAQVVAGLLRPGGRLFLREGHPSLWSIDDERSDGLVIGYPYFETVEPSEWDEAQTYVATEGLIAHTKTNEWNHGLGEIVQAVLDAGMRLTQLVEHRSVPWQAIPGMVSDERGEWALRDHGERLPLSYTLQAMRE